MVTAPATHTQNTHTGSRALTRRGGCTHLTKTQKKNSKTAVREEFITAQATSSVSMHASTSADSISVREIVRECVQTTKKITSKNGEGEKLCQSHGGNKICGDLRFSQ